MRFGVNSRHVQCDLVPAIVSDLVLCKLLVLPVHTSFQNFSHNKFKINSKTCKTTVGGKCLLSQV